MLTDQLGPLAPINDVDQLDRNVFYQQRWWFDRAGRAHVLEEMGATYRHNLLRFLWCDRRSLHAWDALATVMADDPLELSRVLTDGAARRLPHQLDADAWFASRPLTSRLLQLVGEVPATFADGNPGDELTALAAAHLHRHRAATLAVVWPELAKHLEGAGAPGEQVTQLRGHVLDACRRVLDVT